MSGSFPCPNDGRSTSDGQSRRYGTTRLGDVSSAAEAEEGKDAVTTGIAGMLPASLLIALAGWTITAVVLRRRRDSSPPPPSGESVSFKCAAGIDWLHGSYPLGRVTIDREHLVIELAGLSRAVLPRQEVLRIRRRRLTGYWVITPGRRRLRFNTLLGRNRTELQRAMEWGWPLELP